MEQWLGVELRHLAALLAIEQERSFRGAADRLGYVQSAVSQQISQFEALVGMRLVDRERGHAPVRLTEPGDLLVEHARQILGQLDAAQADLRSLAAGEAPTLRVGVDQSIAMRVMPGPLRALARQRPPVAILLEEADGDRAHFGRVDEGLLDVAIAELPLEPGPFECVEVLVDPCVLLVPASSPLLAADGPPTLEDLVAEPLVAVREWPMMELVEAQLRGAGLEPAIAMHARSSATVQALVAAGVGPAILPRLTVNEADPQVGIVDLDGLLPARRLALYWHEGRRHLPALRPLLAAVRGATREIKRGWAAAGAQATPAAADAAAARAA